MKLSEKASIFAHFLRARWRWHYLRGSALERYHEKRAQAIVAYTARHAPFYRAHWADHPLQEWRTLPPVDKQLMMAHFDTFNTRQIRRDTAMEVALRAERERDFLPSLHGLTVGLSSGTSGHRGLFLVSAQEQAAWAGTILARTLHTLPLRPLRVAFFLRSNSNLYEQVGGGRIEFRYFDLMMPLDEAVAALNTFLPEILIGPPSLLALLAHAALRGELRARPNRLISVAEVLEEQDRRLLEQTFQASLHQIYQCTEGLLALSCERGSLHIQEDAVILQFEVLPESQGKRAMPIVTDLWRRTQPIIRYRLNDVLQLEPAPCACGSPFRVIRAIEGRCDDICYFSALDGSARPFFPDTIRRMILLADPQILDYRVVQQKPGHLHVYLAIEPESSFEQIAASVLANIGATVAHYACRPAIVRIEQGLPTAAPGAKLRRVQALL